MRSVFSRDLIYIHTHQDGRRLDEPQLLEGALRSVAAVARPDDYVVGSVRGKIDVNVYVYVSAVCVRIDPTPPKNKTNKSI